MAYHYYLYKIPIQNYKLQNTNYHYYKSFLGQKFLLKIACLVDITSNLTTTLQLLSKFSLPVTQVRGGRLLPLLARVRSCRVSPHRELCSQLPMTASERSAICKDKESQYDDKIHK